jgi:hypothetical protein
MDIRDELDKAMQAEFGTGEKLLTFTIAAQFAARWMAERCAKNVEGHWNGSMDMTNQKDQAYRSAASIRMDAAFL